MICLVFGVPLYLLVVKSVVNCSMFCCTLFYAHSSFAIILMGKRELVALHSLSSWCLAMVVWLFLAVPWVYLRFVFVIVVFPDHTHYFCMCKVTELSWSSMQYVSKFSKS